MSGFGVAGPPAAPHIEGWKHLRTGKVREIYINTAGELLLVASDRISAFDWVLPTEIPGKGVVLTQLSLFWFEKLAHLVQHHVVSEQVPASVAGRAIIAKPLTMYPIECVARGYLTGSGWSEYKSSQSVCGIDLPAGLLDGSKLPDNIFTPATKAEIGDHDMNISYEEAAQMVSDASKLRDLTLALYSHAAEYARTKGIILADTKFEFGTSANGTITLGDEALTPDSSRFWDASTWLPGGAQPSFDKQYVRDYLVATGWDRESAPPELPSEVVEKTADRYREAYKRLTGSTFTF